METMTLHRGRLIDHIQLVVRDIEASRRFYKALFEVLELPLGGEGDDHFWVDELFVSTADSEAAAGELTGRHHLAFQARDRAMVDAWHSAGLKAGGRENGAPASATTTPAITPPSCSTPTATTSRRSSMARRGRARRASR